MKYLIKKSKNCQVRNGTAHMEVCTIVGTSMYNLSIKIKIDYNNADKVEDKNKVCIYDV